MGLFSNRHGRRKEGRIRKSVGRGGSHGGRAYCGIVRAGGDAGRDPDPARTRNQVRRCVTRASSFIRLSIMRWPDCRRRCAAALGGKLLNGLAHPARSWLSPRSIPPHPVKQPRARYRARPNLKEAGQVHRRRMPYLMPLRRQACGTGGGRGGWRSRTRSKGAKRRT